MNVWDVFYFSCNAILPIVLLVVLGYFLKRLKVFDDAFLNKANSIVFKIFLPFLLFFDKLEFINIFCFGNNRFIYYRFSHRYIFC